MEWRRRGGSQVRGNRRKRRLRKQGNEFRVNPAFSTESRLRTGSRAGPTPWSAKAFNAFFEPAQMVGEGVRPVIGGGRPPQQPPPSSQQPDEGSAKRSASEPAKTQTSLSTVVSVELRHQPSPPPHHHRSRRRGLTNVQVTPHQTWYGSIWCLPLVRRGPRAAAAPRKRSGFATEAGLWRSKRREDLLEKLRCLNCGSDTSHCS